MQFNVSEFAFLNNAVSVVKEAGRTVGKAI
jgi:hypothetical protein